jgi:hypothetical protein
MTAAQTAVLAAAIVTPPHGAAQPSVKLRDSIADAFATYLANGSTARNSASVACTFTDAGDLVGKVAHGLVAGDRVIFDTVVTTTGLTVGTEYYVIAAGLTADAFSVATTVGGSAVALTTNGTGTYHKQTGSPSTATRAAVLVAAASAFGDDMQIPKQVTDYADVLGTAYELV